jgi:ribosomal protein L29
VTGQLTDTNRLRQLRRDIARFETILNEPQLTAVQEGEA